MKGKKPAKSKVKSQRLCDLINDQGTILQGTLTRCLVKHGMTKEHAQKEWCRLLGAGLIVKSGMVGGFGEKTVQGYKIHNFKAIVLWAN